MSLWCVDDAGSVFSCSESCSGGGSLARHQLTEREGGSWSFQSTASPSLSLKGPPVALETALDRSRGVTAPFLVSRGPRDSSLEIRSLSPGPTAALVGHVTLEGGADRARGLSVVAGPAVVWGVRDKVCVALFEEDGSGTTVFTRREILLNKFISCPAPSLEGVWFSESPDGLLLLFVRYSSPTHQGAEPEAECCCLSVEIERGGRLNVRQLPSRQLLPREYGSLAVCVAVGYHWRVGPDGEVWSDPCVVVATSYRQVVVLRGGIPVHCISVKIEPIDLNILQVCEEGFLLAVGTTLGGVTVYRVPWEEEGEEPTVIGEWEGVVKVLAGDFARLSREQLLLIITEEEGGGIVEFLVTDFTGFTAASESRREVVPAHHEVSQSLVSAVEALRVRQQRGETQLTELERELQLKTQLLREGLESLQNTQPTPSLPARDLSLVCILPGKVEGRIEDNVAMVTDSAHCVPVVTGCWQRLLDGQWVVGVVLKNNTNSVLGQVSVCVRCEGVPVVRGRSQLVWVSSERESSCDEPPSKRAKTKGAEFLVGVLREAGVERVKGVLDQISVPHGDRACLVSWVPLPSLAEWREFSGVLSGSMVVSWRGSLVMGEGVSVVELGRVELCQQQLSDPTLQCDRERGVALWEGGERVAGDLCDRDTQDLACLLATQHIAELKLRSKFTDLNSLAETLRHRMPLPPCHILPRPCSIPPRNGLEPGPKIEVLSELERVYLYISGSRHTATVSVLHRSTPSLSVVVSAIQNCVPDDVTISHPHSPPTLTASHLTAEQTQSLRQCVAGLRRELSVQPAERDREETDLAMFRALQALGL